MTVIAWDGKVLAGDRRAINGSTPYSVTKIRRIGDRLVGVAGCFPRAMLILKWVEAGMDPKTFPQEHGENDYVTMLMIHPDGRIERYESRPEPILVEEPRHAIGSGRDFAMMAMHMGADAFRAVSLTCDLSVECGNGVDVLVHEEIVGAEQ